MSRKETMQEERWRVQVWGPDGRVTHESQGSEKAMRDYFETLAMPDSTMYLQKRRAGKSRYVNREIKNGPRTTAGPLATFDLDLQIRDVDRLTMSRIVGELREILDGWGYDYSGEVQAECASCGVLLTTGNQGDCGDNGLADDCCQKCWDEDEGS